MSCSPKPLLLALLILGFFAPLSACFAQTGGQGAYLEGLRWYDLSTERDPSVKPDVVARWKRDLRKVMADKRDQQARDKAGKKARIEDVMRRHQIRESELRVSPSNADLDNGDALNALFYDLCDPDISTADWQSKVVELPEGMSVKDLIFRFVGTSSTSKTTKALNRGVIALTRLETTDKWPPAINQAAMEKERAAYETSYSKIRDLLLEGKFELNSVLALDKSLEALKAKVKATVPTDRGFRTEAVRFVDDLKDATCLFDAATVDYAKEILTDTKEHEATSVAELVAFMLKYRLQFASAERVPACRAMYGLLYEALRQQVKDMNGSADGSTLDGIWEDGPNQITIVQKGEEISATCAYRHPQHGEITWHMTGTVTKDGQFKARIVHTKAPKSFSNQTRTGVVSADGNKISGRAEFDGGGGADFVFTRKQPVK